MAPVESTQGAPKRSASAPASGWPTPQSSICSPSASAMTSRPQPLALEIGRRKNASPTRGPKPITPMAQPQSRMTTGVRQGEDAEDGAASANGPPVTLLIVVAASRNQPETRDARHKITRGPAEG